MGFGRKARAGEGAPTGELPADVQYRVEAAAELFARHNTPPPPVTPDFTGGFASVVTPSFEPQPRIDTPSTDAPKPKKKKNSKNPRKTNDTPPPQSYPQYQPNEGYAHGPGYYGPGFQSPYPQGLNHMPQSSSPNYGYYGPGFQHPYDGAAEVVRATGEAFERTARAMGTAAGNNSNHLEPPRLAGTPTSPPALPRPRAYPQQSSAESQHDKKPRKPLSKRQRWLGAAVVVAVAGLVTSPLVKGFAETTCKDAEEPDVIGKCATGVMVHDATVDKIPGPREFSQLLRGTPGQEQDSGTQTTVPGDTANNPAPSEKPKPEAQPLDPRLEKLTFSQLFPKGVVLGRIATSTPEGKVSIQYDKNKKSVQISTKSQHTLEFTAQSKLVKKQIEQNGKKVDVWVPESPLKLSRNDDGTPKLEDGKYVLEFNRGAITMGINMASLTGLTGDYKVTSGSAKDGFSVARTSSDNSFSMKFLPSASKTLLKPADASVNEVNPFLAPTEGNAPIVSNLFDLKHVASEIESVVTDKCVNPDTNQPLQTTAMITAKIDTSVANMVQQWARDNQLDGFKFRMTGEYSFNATAILEQTAVLATASTDPAVQERGQALGNAISKQAGRFSASPPQSCKPDKAFKE